MKTMKSSLFLLLDRLHFVNSRLTCMCSRPSGSLPCTFTIRCSRLSRNLLRGFIWMHCRLSCGFSCRFFRRNSNSFFIFILPLRNDFIIAFGHFHIEFRHIKAVIWLEWYLYFSLINRYLNHGNTLRYDAQLTGSAIGKIDDTTTGKRSSVDNTYYNFLAVGRISHF